MSRAILFLSITIAFGVACTSVHALEHPAGAHCVTYKSSGMGGKGEITRCTDGGETMVETRDVRVGIGPFGKRENKVVITQGPTIFTVDHKKKQTLRANNPLYKSVTEQHNDAYDANAYWLDAMGFSLTTDTARHAEETCRVYRSQMLGKVCMTDDLITLSQENIGQSLVAITIQRDTAGPSEHYDPASFGYPLIDVPDVGALLSGSKQVTSEASADEAAIAEAASAEAASDEAAPDKMSAEEASSDKSSSDDTSGAEAAIDEGMDKLKALFKKRS